ncbi:MAG: dihydrolipoyl dehydrogenase family protein [Gammaproteobacteria bacterium]
MRATDFDICIIGGGSAGLVTAAGAAALGARTVLVEKHRLGGECLYTGCIPSKTLLHCAHSAAFIRRADVAGLSAQLAAPDLNRLMQHVSAVIAEIAPHDSPERFRALGVEVIESDAHFTSPYCVVAGGREIRSRRYVIATGSKPLIPAISGLDDSGYFTNETIFSLRESVTHLAVIGGGPVGVELAQAFARLGSRVSLFEMAKQILPAEDDDVAGVLAVQLRQDGVELCTGVKVERADNKTDGALGITYVNGDGVQRECRASHLLVAAGRRPVLKNLGLERAGVLIRDGRLAVDTRLRTSQPHIYACGDVIGPWRFTHMAEHQAGIVLRNALLHLRARPSQVIPWCTFTEPEVARVGLSEREARAKNLRHEVYRVPFSRADRAQTDNQTQGFIKLLTDRRGRLLGAAIVGAHAGELIHEFALAMARRMRAKDISACIHLYPALAQLNRFVADERMKIRLTPTARRWLQRIFRLRGARA